MRRERMTRGVGRWVVVGAVVASALVGLGGCLQLLGDDGTFIEKGAGGGGTGGVTGGTGGVGGAGGTTTQECKSGIAEPCYEGPAGTETFGVCKGGMHTCGADGKWGTCEGEITPTAETCVTKTDEDCDKKECALWSSIWPASMGSLALDIQADSKGNVLVLGAFQGTIALGADILDDSGGGGSLFLAKFDSSGAPLWAFNLGGNVAQGEGGYSLAVDAADNIYLGLTFQGMFTIGTTTYTSSGNDFLLAKFTPSGVMAWSNYYGGPNDQDLWNIAVDNQGNLRALGIYKMSIDIGGSGANSTGVFVAKISSSDGFPDSVMTLPLGEYATPHFAIGSDGNWALAGRCADGATIGGMVLNPCGYFVARFTSDDALTWATAVPLQADDIAIRSSGAVLITAELTNTTTFGASQLTSHGGLDVAVAELSAADGAVAWAKNWGGSDDEAYAQVTVGDQDRFYILVNAQDTIDFGGGPLEAAGLADTFVAAFDGQGSHRWSRVFGDATLQNGQGVARPDGKGLFVSVTTAGDIDFGAGSLHSDAAAFALTQLAP